MYPYHTIFIFDIRVQCSNILNTKVEKGRPVPLVLLSLHGARLLQKEREVDNDNAPGSIVMFFLYPMVLSRMLGSPPVVGWGGISMQIVMVV